MERYVAGDTAAFNELFRRYERRAYSYFLRRSRSVDRAQDLYQELFLRIHRAREDYDPQRAFAPWFFQIARRLLIDDEGRAYRARELSIEGGEFHVDQSNHADLLAEREHLTRLFDGVSADDAYILVAAKGEGIGYPDLASRLGRSTDAVKKAASRAMQRLREVSEAHLAAPAPTLRQPARKRTG